MTNRLISLAILITVIGSAAFQVIILIVAGWSNIEMIGSSSLCQSIAVLICAVSLSDLKSLSIRSLVEDESLERLSKVRNAFLAVIMVLAMIVSIFPYLRLLSPLLMIKASAQAADINVSLWQKEEKPFFIIMFACLRYGVSGAALALVALISRNYLLALYITACLSIIVLILEQYLASKITGNNSVSWRMASLKAFNNKKFIAAYTSLSLAAGLNFLPQTILRYFVGLFGSLRVLGSFSVQYQFAMLCVPIITAMSQQALARRYINWQDIVDDMIKIGYITAALLTVVAVIFLSPANMVITLAFKSWVPMPAFSSAMIIVSAAFLCMTVYLGFISVALDRPFAQSVANISYLVAILVCSSGLGFLYGVSGVIVGFTIATCVRLILLFGIVRRAGMNR